jgi:hypothetical protein
MCDDLIIPVDMALAWSGSGLRGHACHRRLEPAVVVTATTKSQGQEGVSLMVNKKVRKTTFLCGKGCSFTLSECVFGPPLCIGRNATGLGEGWLLHNAKVSYKSLASFTLVSL